MKTFRWPTTLLLICGAAALLALAAFDLAGSYSMAAVVLAVALVLLALLFGKRGV